MDLQISLTTENDNLNASLHAVEQFYLPNWDERDCPWCKEYATLSKASNRMADPPEWLNNRVALLTLRDQGIQGEPLLLLEGVEARTLGHGSLAGPGGLSSLSTLFAVAAGVQALRHDNITSRRMDVGFPISNVFATKNLINFDEGLLRAAILRVVKTVEWGVIGERDLRERFEVLAQSEDQDVLLGEMLLALSRRIISRAQAQSLIDAISSIFLEKLGEETYKVVIEAIFD